MRVLGIDPGSETTGWGVIEGDARRYTVVAFGALRASPREAFALRLLKISNGLEEVIAQYAPGVCSVEEAFFAVNVKTALKLGQARGVVLLAAARASLEIHEYSPRLVKQTVVGYGAAEKQQVQEMVRVLLHLARAPQPHDAADALALAICHLHHVSLNEQTGKTRVAVAPARAQLEALTSAMRRRVPR